jgi:hypothetical protein
MTFDEFDPKSPQSMNKIPGSTRRQRRVLRELPGRAGFLMRRDLDSRHWLQLARRRFRCRVDDPTGHFSRLELDDGLREMDISRKSMDF